MGPLPVPGQCPPLPLEVAPSGPALPLQGTRWTLGMRGQSPVQRYQRGEAGHAWEAAGVQGVAPSPPAGVLVCGLGASIDEVFR